MIRGIHTTSTSQKTLQEESIKKDLSCYSLNKIVGTFCITCFSAIFTTYLGAVFLVVTGCMEIITNIVLKTLFSAAEYTAHLKPAPISPERIRQVFEFLIPLSSMFFGLQKTAVCLVHELGHAAAAKTLFQTNPMIYLYPFRGGKTIYSAKRLSGIGQIFGKSRAKMLTILAGPICSVIFATGCFLLDYASPSAEEYSWKKRASNLLASLGRAAICYELHSACSCVFYPNKQVQSDYFSLWKNYNIHPTYAIASILIIPFLSTQLAAKHKKPSTNHS